MAIYKPSNLSPNLKEIDLDLEIPIGWDKPDVDQSILPTDWQANIFEAQVNTTGENVLAYRLTILDNNSDKIVYESPPIAIAKSDRILYGRKDGVKNKGFVKTCYAKSDEYKLVDGINTATSFENFIINKMLNEKDELKNGKDYQWSIRMYDAPIKSLKQPITKVCDGFIVGSTGYVIWTKPGKELNEYLLYDRYVEFEASVNNIVPFMDNKNNVKYPTGNNTEIERVQIDWVEKELGTNKDFTKIELIDEEKKGLKYNYKDNTLFYVFLCDNKHTMNSAYADPNSSINSSMFMARFSRRPSSVKVKFKTESDLSSLGNFLDLRRIIGTSTVTGELRVQEPFISVPQDGDYYVLYEYNRIDGEYVLVENQLPADTVKDKTVTSSAISLSTSVLWKQIYRQRIGGIPVGVTDEDLNNNNLKTVNSVKKFHTVSNRWDSQGKRLFIQPNINIKTDPYNPNEIVFDVNGVRVDIIQKIEKVNTGLGSNTEQKDEDVTFNKLDNTQWLLEGSVMKPFTSDGKIITNNSQDNKLTTPNMIEVPIIPGSIYTIYTDFMDAIPNGVFYARKTPTITMKYRNMNNDEEDYISIKNDAKKLEEDDNFKGRPWRDIEFKAEWESLNHTQIKYYKYTLYDKNGEIIKEGEDTYDTDLYFWFRGFSAHESYVIELLVIDELNKEFITRQNFNVEYNIENENSKLDVFYDCNKQAFRVTADTPLFAVQSERDGKKYVNESNMSVEDDTVMIPTNMIMNYDKAFATGYPNIVLTKPLSYITQFRLTKEFFSAETSDKGRIITEIECQRTNNPDDGYDRYTLRLTSPSFFYIDSTKNILITNTDRLKLRWYRNTEEEPLECFEDENGNMKDTINLIEELGFEDITSLNKNGQFNFTVQRVSSSQFSIYYHIVDDLNKYNPANENDKLKHRYILTQTCIVKGETFSPGVYVEDESKSTPTERVWGKLTNISFLFIENMSQLPGFDYENFIVNDPMRGTVQSQASGVNWPIGPEGSLRFFSSGTTETNDGVWAENFDNDIVNTINKLSQKWFMLYLTINENNDVKAIIKLNDEKVV